MPHRLVSKALLHPRNRLLQTSIPLTSLAWNASETGREYQATRLWIAGCDVCIVLQLYEALQYYRRYYLPPTWNRIWEKLWRNTSTTPALHWDDPFTDCQVNSRCCTNRAESLTEAAQLRSWAVEQLSSTVSFHSLPVSRRNSLHITVGSAGFS